MNSDELIEQGDFAGALEVLRQSTSGPQPEPAALLSRFSMEVRLQQFDAAENTMQRLAAVSPETAGVMSQFTAAARAERSAIQRLSDPAVAGKRATIGLPPPHAIALVKAADAHARGDAATAKAAIAEAKSLTPATSGTVNRKNGTSFRFTDITDTDDLTGATLPVYEGPALLDLAYSEIRSITFENPRTSFDIMWPRAEIALVTGEILHVRVPALYPGSGKSGESHIRTGQMTMWSRDKGYAVGHGQRDLSFTTSEGNPIVGLLGIASMTFDNPMRAGARPGGNALGGAGFVNQDKPWTSAQSAVAWGVGILLALRFFRPGMFINFDGGPQIMMHLTGLIISAGAGWLAWQRSSKVAGIVVGVILFVVMTLRWIM